MDRCRLFCCHTFGCYCVKEWQVWKTAKAECLIPSLPVDKTGELKCFFFFSEISYAVSGKQMRKQNLSEDHSQPVVENILGSIPLPGEHCHPLQQLQHQAAKFLLLFGGESQSVLVPGPALPGSLKAPCITQVKCLENCSHLCVCEFFPATFLFPQC